MGESVDPALQKALSKIGNCVRHAFGQLSVPVASTCAVVFVDDSGFCEILIDSDSYWVEAMSLLSHCEPECSRVVEMTKLPAHGQLRTFVMAPFATVTMYVQIGEGGLA